MKKYLALLLTFALCFALIPAIGAENAETKVLTESEKALRNQQLIAYSEDLNAMIDAYGLNTERIKTDNEFETGRIVVKASKDLDYTGSVAHVKDNDKSVIQYATPEEAEAACKMYASLSYVEYAEPDTIVTLDDYIVEDDAETDDVPGDYNYMSWGYGPNYVNANDYNTWIYNYAGQDMNNLPTIIVAVIDTGVDSDHELFTGRLIGGGYDFVNNDSDPEDDEGHGTHCSGTVIDGTLPNVLIMGVKVLGDDGRGYSTWVAAGMEWGMNNANVCSMSLGGDCGGQHSQYNSIIDQAYAHNIPFCVAAGNESDDASNHCPANCPNAITVAASTKANALASFSNYGSIVDITAPGANIKSARIGGGKTTMSGTSMATPHVSAVAAMLKSYDPDMTVADLTQLICDNAIPVTYTNGGAGILCVTNIYAGFDQPLPTPVEPTEPPVDPTEPPADPTEPPVDPTEPPVSDTGWYFEEDPEDEGWYWLDEDGDGNEWQWMLGEGMNVPEGEGMMNSQSFINDFGPLTPDNWLISPVFEAGTQVSFMMVGQDPAYAAEYIGVYVSVDGGETWSDEIAGFTATGEVTTYFVDTAAYAGQMICVAFRHYNVTDMFSVNLDAVEVIGASDDPGLLGDVDGNGVVDLIDASLLNRYVLGLVGANDLDLTVADVDASGNIDLIDVICIMRMVLSIGA